jgi:hypothetical protein
MVASFCGRSFDDNETNEIAQRNFTFYYVAEASNFDLLDIRRATTNINLEIETLLEYLTHKGAIG